MKRTCLVLSLLCALLPDAVGCEKLSLEEGVFTCKLDSDCPKEWVCDRRGDQSQDRCWQRLSPTIDGGPNSPNNDADAFKDTPEHTGPRSYPDLDAGSQYRCGAWKRVRHSDAPPPNAEPLGHEYDPLLGPGKQYVCKFELSVDGRVTTLQGKGAFGFGCFAPAPSTATVPARRLESADFQVLVDTKDCARMGVFDPNLRLMPTGLDGEGKPTYSCRAYTPSPKVSGQVDLELGRFDPDTRVCTFVLGVQVIPQTEGVDALMIP